MAPLSILFICIGNTCRSPMAEAIARGQKKYEVVSSSAGIMPFGRIVRSTVEAVEALGYDPGGLSSKGLENVDLEDFENVGRFDCNPCAVAQQSVRSGARRRRNRTGNRKDVSPLLCRSPRRN